MSTPLLTLLQKHRETYLRLVELETAFGGALGLIHFGRRRGSTWATATRRDRDPSRLGWIRVRMDPRRV